MDQKYEEIIEKCLNLGKLIADTPVYQEFKKAEYNLMHNPEARKLVEDLQTLKKEHYLKKMAGTEISKEDEEKMKELENVCLSNNQVYASNNANNNFQKLMETISGKIREGIQSI
ncbi:hypothetical protein DEAC_c27510 [Desulfosporosinus acididurans]|uniref:YlbF family regulator n=1 Tax=Desulfosporosinus acididurans TaxID=476652 RepID=A0A0J1FNX4_9FIRM|nr:YlbF family regulator [Desulfosporosinus acididurans]KLU65199.1 hypothetical protein DEAC_c27510 [Desulfosporosinus acididurans]